MTRHWKQLSIFAAAFLVLVGGTVYAVLRFTPLGMMVFLMIYQNPGSFQRVEFEAIVKAVRDKNLPPGKSETFQVDGLARPESLRRVAPAPEDGTQRATRRSRSNIGHYVWAEMTPDKKLIVVIETRDLGHAGIYGFAYSDAPLKLSESKHIEVPGAITSSTPEMKIDDHWRGVYNNLD